MMPVGANLVVNGNFNHHTWLDVDGGNLLHSLRWGVQVDDTLVNAHLKSVVSVGTLTIWCLPGHDPQSLGGHAHRPFAHQTLVLGSFDEIGTHLLEGLDIAGCKVDKDLVDPCLLSFHELCSGFCEIRHVCCWGMTGALCRVMPPM